MSAGAWWDAFSGAGGLEELKTWLGGVDADSRVRVRDRIAAAQYLSVLDCGAGLGLDYIGLTNLSHDCHYQGIEPSVTMREAAAKVAEAYGHDAPLPIIAGDITDIPFHDREFELVYCRHVLEHLPRFEPALLEMLRVAKLETMVVFFMRPASDPWLFRERDGLWQNRYARADIEAVLNDHPRVEVWFWELLTEGQEAILHVLMTDSTEVEVERVAERIASK